MASISNIEFTYWVCAKAAGYLVILELFAPSLIICWVRLVQITMSQYLLNIRCIKLN